MKNSDYNKLSNLFLFFFFIVSFVEIIAELFNDNTIEWVTKPLIIPFLLLYYILRSRIRNNYFIVALLFSLISNVFFIENSFLNILLGSFFGLGFMIVIIYLVISLLKKPHLNLIIIGAIPFAFIYLAILIFKFEFIDSNILYFVLNALFVIFLGGFSLGNYIIYKSKTNYTLFICALLFATMHFVYLLKNFSMEKSVVMALSMLFYVFGQFMLVRFILLAEKKNRNYKIVNV